ncbi:hypothetical protein CVT26_007448 [Gymnopilus dilepis]|uniref:Uncharacterized protein n=1 Tax=Gymnopilus dilepis TaxID=231916 RepID=A0A409WWI1_9AGAR|nr:hypothetical protein CVT26_007448 [Gymnopilus dilepis]
MEKKAEVKEEEKETRYGANAKKPDSIQHPAQRNAQVQKHPKTQNKTNLLPIPSRIRHRQHPILNRARAQMVQHHMARDR